jgi:hypothetical protein
MRIEATPKKLREYVKFRVERAVNRKIERGELELMNGGEKWCPAPKSSTILRRSFARTAS